MRWCRVAGITVVAGLLVSACGGGEDGDEGRDAERSSPSSAATAAPAVTVPVARVPGAGPWKVFAPVDERRAVDAATVSADGTVWGAEQLDGDTRLRLYRFEGERWAATPDVACTAFLPTIAGGPGSSVSVPCTEGIATFDGEAWSTVPLPDTTRPPRVLDVDAAGRAWAPAPGHGGVMRRLDGGTWDEFPLPDGAPSPLDAGFDFGGLPDGSAWVRTATGVAHLVDGEWVQHDAEGAPDATVLDATGGDDGSVWLFVSRSPTALEWQRLLDGEWTVFPIDVGGLPVDAACAGGAGQPATGFDDPAERVAAATLALGDLAVAGDGSLWTATQCVGVTHFQPTDGSASVSATADGLPALVFGNLEVGPDAVWVTGTFGLARLPT